MAMCDCYYQQGLKFLCYGTKEMEECSCGGDESKCNFYPEKRAQATQKVKTMPTVEVVHGRWKYYHKQNIAVCTNCSFERNLDDNFGKAISCPNCGADMRERRTDG